MWKLTGIWYLSLMNTAGRWKECTMSRVKQPYNEVRLTSGILKHVNTNEEKRKKVWMLNKIMKGYLSLHIEVFFFLRKTSWMWQFGRSSILKYRICYSFFLFKNFVLSSCLTDFITHKSCHGTVLNSSLLLYKQKTERSWGPEELWQRKTLNCFFLPTKTRSLTCPQCKVWTFAS